MLLVLLSRDSYGVYDASWTFRYRSLWSRLGKWRGLLSFNPAKPEVPRSRESLERAQLLQPVNEDAARPGAAV